EKVGLGEFVTRDDIERRQAVRLSQVLADLPRMDFQPFCPGWRCLVPIIRGRSPACRRVKREGLQAFIGPSIYLNGRRVPMVVGGGLFGIDDLTNPSDIAGIEVYTGIGDLPADFADFNAQRCGAIAIWTGN
ncbi:MAG: TonB-dependent receptor plug domain-containing protein, partial [Acidimicrobiia bacterium]